MASFEIPRPPQSFAQRMRQLPRLAAAYLKGDKVTISDITSATIFSPLQPIIPPQPFITGRQWDYLPGYNVNFLPRGYGSGLVQFSELRNLARNCEILRLGIETCIDQICSFGWQIVPKEDTDLDPEDDRIKELTEFFKRPDKIHTWAQWAGAILEELLVTDAVTIYRPKDRVGSPYAFELYDGSTIFPLIDENGRTPQPPDPAYQQILKGSPRVDYTAEELLYRPKKVRVYTPYGYSAVEQVIVTARKAINRDAYQLAYFTAGSVPDAYAEMPEDMSPDEIRSFEERFNNLLTGNATQRKQIPFLPAGSKIAQLKEAILTDAFDEWLARIICFALSLPPNAFVKQQNRATAESEKDRAMIEGQGPRLQYLKNICDELIADFGPEYSDNFEWAWKEGKNQDPKEQADVLKELVGSGIKTINEGRADLGLDPIEGGDKPMALTPTGYVPLDSFEQQQEMQQKNMDAQAKAKADAATAHAQAGAPQGGASNEDVAGKSAYGRVGKAVRHTPLPFDDPHSHEPKKR